MELEINFTSATVKQVLQQMTEEKMTQGELKLFSVWGGGSSTGKLLGEESVGDVNWWGFNIYCLTVL